MELSDLRIFLAVADEEGFTAAAKKLNYVQPNVTGRIKKLEEELGVSLFYRRSWGVALTPPGRQFLRYANRIMRLSREASKELQTGTPSGPLSIGVNQTAASAYLPDILRDYHARFPEVEITVKTLFAATFPEELLDHSLDYALAEIPVSHPELVTEASWPQKLVMVSAPDYPLDEAGVTALAFSDDCPYRAAMQDAFEREGIVAARELKLHNLDAILACAMGGVGVAVLPECLVDRAHIAPHVRTRPLSGEEGTAAISLLRHKDSLGTPQAQAFSLAVQRRLGALTEQE